MTQQSLSRRLLLPATLVAMFVLCVAPLRITGWVSWFGDLARVTVAPIEAPLAAVARILNKDRSRQPDPEVVALLKNERDLLIAKIEQIEAQNGDLNRMFQDFITGDLLAPLNPPVRQYATIIGRTGTQSSTILQARGGTNKGINEGYVAVIGGAQIVGKVVATSILDCEIRPITDRNASGISGVVKTKDGQEFDCFLMPTGDGLLEGSVAGAKANAIEGLIVRLNDDSWPGFVQRYEIGKVKTAIQSDEHALQIKVTVEPKVAKLDLLSEVFILLPTGEGG